MLLTSKLTLLSELVDTLHYIIPVLAFLILITALIRIFNYLFSCSLSDSTGAINIEKHKSSGSEFAEVSDELSSIHDADGVMELSKELRKNDVVKMVHVSQSFDDFSSRDIPYRCPYCWGIPDDSGICQYCGSRLI